MILRFSSLSGNYRQHRHLVPKHHPPPPPRHLPSSTPNKGLKPGFKLRYFRSEGGLLSAPSVISNKSPADPLTDALGKLTPKEITALLRSQTQWRSCLDLLQRLRSLPRYEPNTFHYNVVVRSLVLAGQWAPLRRLWLQMSLEDGLLPDNITYSVLIDAYGRRGLPSHGLLWLRHMRLLGIFPDELAMCTVLRVLRDSRRLAPAIHFFRSWCQGKLDLDALKHDVVHVDHNTTANEEEEVDANTDDASFGPEHFVLTELSRVGGSRPWVTQPHQPGHQRSPRLTLTYNMIMDLYAKAGKLEEVYYTFVKMLRSGTTPNTTTLNTMIYICGSRGGIDEAEALLQKMRERRVWPNTKTFNMLMSFCASHGDVDGVLRYYRKIRGWRLNPDRVSYKIFLQFVCERGMVPDVESAIEEMELFNIEVDEQLLLVVTKMYVSEGLPLLGKKFLEKHCSGRVVSSYKYAAMINVYAEKGLWEDAEDVFNRRRCSGCKMDALEFNVMIKAYGKVKLYDKALSLFESMVSSGTCPDARTYNSLVQMLAGGDLLDKAKELLAEMCHAGFNPRCETFSSIIACCARMGLVLEAEELFNEMKESGAEPNEVVYGALINLFAELGRAEDALRYFHLMEKSGIHANQIVLTSLIKAYSKIGCWQEAIEFYAKMNSSEDGPDVVASNCMINLYSKLEMVSAAEAIFDTLRQSGRADEVSYFTMMHLYKNMGMLDKTVEFADDMQQAGLLTDCRSYTTVIALYASSGRIRKCGKLFHQMRKIGIFPDEETFKVIFNVLKKSRLSPEAVVQLETSYVDEKPYAKQAIVSCFFSVAKLPIYACKTCESFIMRGDSLDLFAYNAAIFTYSSSNEVNKALNLSMRMHNEGLKPDVVTNIHLARCYAKAGLLEGIKQIHVKLQYGEIELTKSLFRAVIAAYKKLGKFVLKDMFIQEMRFRLSCARGE